MLSVLDAIRLLLAVAACGIVVALPGIALARAFGIGRDPLTGTVVGLAVLPLLASLATRFFGLDAALALTLGLAVAGVALALRDGGPRLRFSRLAVAALLAWLAIVTLEWIDLDVAGKLYQPLTVIDTVKHAATTQAIVDSGAPPRDPFFLRPERASYYYFFYTLAGLAQRLSLGLLDARAAVGGMVFWTGLGVYGLVRMLLARAGLVAPTRRADLLTLAILAAGGLDILGVVRIGVLQGMWIAEPASWNEQVAGWIDSLLWVPHHVTGLIAAMLGLMALVANPHPRSGGGGPCEAWWRGRPPLQTSEQALDPTFPDWSERRPPPPPPSAVPLPRFAGEDARTVVLAALCFAATLGLSVWVALGLVGTVGIWSLLLLVERRWRLLGLIALAGALAILIALPQFHDLVAGRAGGGPSPIALTVRAFTPVDGLLAPGLWRMLARLVALPLNYFAGFGVLASGAILFWRERDGARLPEMARVLACAAIAGLLLGAFLKSTLFNNDLGWRVVLFPLLAGTVWTIAALERHLGAAADTPKARMPVWRRAPAFLVALLVLGWATSLYGLVGLRAHPWFADEAQNRFIAADPTTERDLRLAYAWAERALPPGVVLQHDPGRPRAFAFALYGRHPAAVADSFGSLFGAAPAAVDARIDALAPLFRRALPPATVEAVARANHVDDLVVTAADPVWSQPGSFVWRARPAYASERVRIIPVAALAGLPDTSDEAAKRPGS